MRHIILGNNFWMYFVFDGIVFGGKSEGIPAHRIQNVVALHSPFAGHNIQSRIYDIDLSNAALLQIIRYQEGDSITLEYREGYGLNEVIDISPRDE